jgi:ferredoxin
MTTMTIRKILVLMLLRSQAIILVSRHGKLTASAWRAPWLHTRFSAAFITSRGRSISKLRYHTDRTRWSSLSSSSSSDVNSILTSESADGSNKSPQPAQHTVTWKTDEDDNYGEEEEAASSSISFPVYSGETLRTAALRRNVVSPHNGRANLINCRGLGTCGTCAVEILQGQEHLDPPERNTVEQLRFAVPPHNFHNNTKLRLACQIQVRGDIQVLKRTGFWGHKEDVVAAPSSPQHYFGELEYLLDTKSPPPQVADTNNKTTTKGSSSE